MLDSAGRRRQGGGSVAATGPADDGEGAAPRRERQSAEAHLRRREQELLLLNIKNFGYELGRRWFEENPPRAVATPKRRELGWRPSTQRDVESDWFLHWCGALRVGARPHRKLWEFAWLLQNLHAMGHLAPGRRAIGFGCGREPLPSYFASLGMEVLATDLDAEAVEGLGWAETGQHAVGREQCFRPDLADRAAFDRLVSFEPVDMTAIPARLHGGFDIAWSVCCFEHLGSIDAGLAFVRESAKLLRPGGVTIHTTEYNFLEPERTLETGGTVLFRQRDFEALAEALRADGLEVGSIGFDVGAGPLDRYIDLPPYGPEAARALPAAWVGGREIPHLKLSVGGFASTCYGVYARRPAA